MYYSVNGQFFEASFYFCSKFLCHTRQCHTYAELVNFDRAIIKLTKCLHLNVVAVTVFGAFPCQIRVEVLCHILLEEIAVLCLRQHKNKTAD